MIAALALVLVATVPPPTIPIPTDYVPLIDDTHSIVIAVPNTWTDIDTAPIILESGGEQPYIAASTDLTGFLGTFDIPGVLYTAFPWVVNPLDLVEQFGAFTGCESFEVKEYNDPVFIGVVQIGTNCGSTGSTWNMVVASPADHSFTAVVQTQGPPGDLSVQTMLLTFNVAPPVPSS